MYAPYVRSIRAGRTTPHAFSWITWTLIAVVVFLAQLADGGGAGAWPIGASALLTAYVAALAYRHRGVTAITRADWAFLGVSLAALPCWLLTSDPLSAVVLLTGVELAGFGPTFRFAFSHPEKERARFYLLGALRNALAIAALEHYSLTTALFPAAKVLASAMLVAMIAYRRARLRPGKPAVMPDEQVQRTSY
jgi:hypothetical protein